MVILLQKSLGSFHLRLKKTCNYISNIVNFSTSDTIGFNKMMTLISEILTTFQWLIFRFFQMIVTKILSLWYRGEPKRIPTPKSSILMESASSIANRIRNEKVTSYEVVKIFIERINEINDILNCVVDERFEEALEEAKKVDDLIASGLKTKKELLEDTPFLGVPFTTKDSIAVSGLIHAAGVVARKNIKAKKNSEVVELMRKAGGIPLAITNVAELCCWCESNNKIFGKTNNPYDTNRTVGGSSGGEACLITSCGSPIGIGSDIGGSIRIPAAYNGIFGHKPSGEITPLDGLFPCVAPTQMPFNTVGPMSKFSEDLLPALKVITKNCKIDLKLDEEVDISKLKFYYMMDDGSGNLLSPVSKEVKMAVLKVVEHLKKTYDITATKLNLSKLRYANEIWTAKMTTESGSELASALSCKKGKINIFKEIFKNVFGLSNHTMATLLSALREKASSPFESLQCKIYVNMCSQLSKEFEDILKTDGIFIYPSQPTAALYHHESLVKPFNYAYAGIFNVLGLPSTQCPMGLNSEGLPIGIQIVAGKYQDRLTIAFARELESAFNGWKPSPTKGTLVLKNRTLTETKSKF